MTPLPTFLSSSSSLVVAEARDYLHYLKNALVINPNNCKSEASIPEK